MADTWFRNKTWTESIERVFFEKLRRARRKSQYIRIQASELRDAHPDVALRLLDLYFAQGDDFDQAQAHVDRAHAFLALGRLTDAIVSFEAALAREAAVPNLTTLARLDYAELVATRGIRDRYDQALRVLDGYNFGMAFPVEHFRWHAARALIAADSGNDEVARDHAVRALEAAGRAHSGYRYHATLGLVTAEYDALVDRLVALFEEIVAGCVGETLQRASWVQEWVAAMCMFVYLASRSALPLVPWRQGAPGFNVHELGENERTVLRHFPTVHVRLAGSHTKCGCGFNEGREYPECSDDPATERTAAVASSAALLHYVRAHRVEWIYACGSGDEAMSPESERRTMPEDLAADEFFFRQREMLMIDGV